MIIEYDKSKSISEEERVRSLRNSVQRALDEVQEIVASNGLEKDGAIVQKLNDTVRKARRKVEHVESVVEKADQSVTEMQDRMDSGEFNGEDAVLVYIHSSNGMAFKNDAVNTVLTVVIYYGDVTITDQTGLVSAFGLGAYLQWKAKLYGESTYTTIPASDERLSDDGFTFELSPSDVNVQAVFNVEIIVPD